MAAIRTENFIDSVGVNVHLAYTDSKYVDVNSVVSDLKYLGIDHVRDGVLNPSYPGQGSYAIAAQAGIKFDMLVHGGSVPDAIAKMHSFVQAHPGAISAIEGPNEVNNWPVTYNGQTGNAGALAFQAALFDGVNADPLLKDLPVYNLTSWPDLAGKSDYQNFHTYPHNGDQPGQSIAGAVRDQAKVDATKPVVATEVGYYTLPNGGSWGGVDNPTQAKLTLNMLMDAAKSGVKQTYLYQLLDAYADPGGTDMEKHFGLFDVNNNPKDAATAIHNLTTILDDTAASADTFTTGNLAYSISGLPSTGSTLLMQKASGAFDLVVWNEPDIWDEGAHKAIAASGQNATVNLGATYADVKVFDPLKGAAPTQTLSNVSQIQLSVTDHPLIIEVGKSGTAGTPPSSTPTQDPIPNPAPTDQTPAPVPADPTPSPVPTDPVPQAPAPGPIFGTDASDVLKGTDGSDVIVAKAGNDVVTGGYGADTITGGAGADSLSGQGGSDVYKYTLLSDSVPGQGRDVIWGWHGNDKIDLKLIDANTRATGDQDFKWIGSAAFSGRPGELHAYFDGTNTIVEANVNRDHAADFQILIHGDAGLSAYDLIL